MKIIVWSQAVQRVSVYLNLFGGVPVCSDCQSCVRVSQCVLTLCGSVRVDMMVVDRLRWTVHL